MISSTSTAQKSRVARGIVAQPLSGRYRASISFLPLLGFVFVAAADLDSEQSSGKPDTAVIVLGCRLPIIPIAAGTGGILFPECKTAIKVSGEELSIVRTLEGEQIPLFGYCVVGDDGDLLPIGTMAMVEKIQWSQLSPAEGGAAIEEGKPWTPWGAADEQSQALLKCVGVQRFRIIALETREPYPIAHVQLFTDETADHQEPELDEVFFCPLSLVVSVCAIIWHSLSMSFFPDALCPAFSCSLYLSLLPISPWLARARMLSLSPVVFVALSRLLSVSFFFSKSAAHTGRGMR